MKKDLIRLNTSELIQIINTNYIGIKSKYAPLILKFLIAEDNFSNEDMFAHGLNSVDSIDFTLFESILLDPDSIFVDEISTFPKDFQKASIALREEYKKDFPTAYFTDLLLKNKVNRKNDRSISKHFNHQSEFDEIKIHSRESMLEYVDKLGIVANLESYDIYARCINDRKSSKLRLEMHIREENSFPVFEATPFLTPKKPSDLMFIHEKYELIEQAQLWANKIEYKYIMQKGNEMKEYFPDFSIELPVY